MERYVDKWSLDLSREYVSLRQAKEDEIKAALRNKLRAKRCLVGQLDQPCP